MKYDKAINSYLLIVTALALVLCCSYPVVSDDKQPEPQKKAGDPAATGAIPPEKKEPPVSQKEGAPAVEKGTDYDSCSPVFPGAQIAQMMTFAKALSPELPGKLRPILLKCDVDVNNRILGFMEDLQLEVSALEFRDEAQEADFLAEKSKEIEIELLLTEKPLKEDELKKLVTELFALVQKRLKIHASELDLEVTELKKRIEERENLKDRIVDKKIENIKDRDKQGQMRKPGDKLFWD
ncbi:MAG: hypothetical protein V2B18_08155 [Pseudomonadota bacterium]